MIRQSRVVVTGMGVLAANGNNLEAFWASLLEGRSGVDTISLFDPADLKCQVAGEVKGFDPFDYFSADEKPRRMGRFTQFAGACARMALADAGLTREQVETQGQIPVVMGISNSDMTMRSKKPTPFTAVAGTPHSATSLVGYMFTEQPKLITLSNGCASGLDAVCLAAQFIQSGAAEIAVAGSAEASITHYVMESMVKCRSVNGRFNHAPGRASRPFDKQRDKGVLSEGGGIVILESLRHAMARGATPYAEVTGSASVADPREETECTGLQTAMQMAIANAGHSPSDVDFISAHAPSDLMIDQMESRMIENVFKEHACRVPVVSIKGATGNPMGCGGMHQMIATAKTIQERTIPPTTNLEVPGECSDLDYVVGSTRLNDVHCALVNSHGFGRGNVCVVLEPVS